MLLWMLFLALAPADAPTLPAGLSVVRTFQSSPQHPIMLAGAVDFAADGSLYLLDQRLSRIMVWNPDGSFKTAFGDMDDTPEDKRMINAIAMGVGPKECWVWIRGRLMFVYTLDGKLDRVAEYPQLFPKVVDGYSDERFLIAGGAFEDNNFTMKFLITGGTTAHELVSFRNEMIIDGDPKVGQTTFRAFGPDVDIQRDAQGTWYLGYGGAPYLFKVDPKGEIGAQIPITLPEEAVEPSDIQLVEKADYPVWSGQRVSMNDDMTRLDYREPKASFTQFTIKDGKALFVLTPTGGYLTDLYAPSNRATYRIVSLATGQVIAKGGWDLPLESKLFFRDGRIIAALAKADKHCELVELRLDGF